MKEITPSAIKGHLPGHHALSKGHPGFTQGPRFLVPFAAFRHLGQKELLPGLSARHLGGAEPLGLELERLGAKPVCTAPSPSSASWMSLDCYLLWLSRTFIGEEAKRRSHSWITGSASSSEHSTNWVAMSGCQARPEQCIWGKAEPPEEHEAWTYMVGGSGAPSG